MPVCVRFVMLGCASAAASVDCKSEDDKAPRRPTGFGVELFVRQMFFLGLFVVLRTQASHLKEARRLETMSVVWKLLL